MQSVVVTGANGFIGRNIVDYLASKNIQVYALVRSKFQCKLPKSNPYITIIECTMNEYKRAEKYISDVDVFYHCAWEGTSGLKRKDYNIQLKNVEYTCDAVNLAKKLGAKKFIFLGSIIEYEYMKCLNKEEITLGINNMYGIAKLTARHMAKLLAYDKKIDFIETTVSNIYGPGEESPRLINTTLRNMINKEKNSFTSCEQLYDFIYIDDAIKAYYLIGKEGVQGKNYYIGNRNQRKLKDFIYEMRDCVDKNIPLFFGGIPFNGLSLEYNEFDTNLLYDELKFNVSVKFNQGILNTIKWLEGR